MFASQSCSFLCRQKIFLLGHMQLCVSAWSVNTVICISFLYLTDVAFCVLCLVFDNGGRGRQYGIVGLIGGNWENWDFCPVNIPRENRLDLLSLDLSLFFFFFSLTINPCFLTIYYLDFIPNLAKTNWLYTTPSQEARNWNKRAKLFHLHIWSKNQRNYIIYIVQESKSFHISGPRIKKIISSILSKNQRFCLAARSFIRGQQKPMLRWRINY